MEAGETVDRFMPRHADLSYISHCILRGECCAVVGLSNVGKSTLLRSLAEAHAQEPLPPDVHAGSASAPLVTYVDCNMMAEMTEQGFCELILRRLLAEAHRAGLPPETLNRVGSLYGQVVNPSSRLIVPLSLNQALTLLIEEAGRRVVLLLDEFDGPFRELQARDLLNLRALRDKYGEHLVYVVATERLLRTLRQEPEVDEFSELFAHQVRVLDLLCREEAARLIHGYAEGEGPPLSPEDEAFIWQQAGGHPGLLEAVCRVMARSMRPGDVFWRIQEYQAVRAQLEEDPVAHAECAKLWNQLTPEGQRALVLLERGQPTNVPRLLQIQGIIRDGVIFGDMFRGFVRRQGLIYEPRREGIRMDVESGHVWVDGQLSPALTELEYRLLLLLYGRMGDICTKDQIAEAVWGTDYLEAVDDARIDKLVSRLRQKIEPDPREPHHLVTVRGRGYQLLRP